MCYYDDSIMWFTKYKWEKLFIDCVSLLSDTSSILADESIDNGGK